jgi:hypothetical protein
MQALNSKGYTRKALAITGIGMFFTFLFLAPLTAFAATTVTVKTDSSTYAAGATIHVSGTVSPAPTLTGTYVAVSITTPSGTTADANEFAVSTVNGSFSGTFVGGPSYVPNGTYTLTATYNSVSATTTFTYGTAPTTSQTGGSTTTTIVEQTTVTQVVSSLTTVVQQQITTVSAQTATTVTQQFSTTVTQVSTSTVTDSTALAVGAVGLIIAIVAIILAVLTMRKK